MIPQRNILGGDHVEQQNFFRNNKTTNVSEGPNMFMRLGGYPVAANDATHPCKPLPWIGAQPVNHCETLVSQRQNLHTRSSSGDHYYIHNQENWGGRDMEYNFRGNPHLKSAFRNHLAPTQLKRDNFEVPSLCSVTSPVSNLENNGLHSLAEVGTRPMQFLGPFPGSLERKISSTQRAPNDDKLNTQSIQDLIRALQTGGSRSKMEAAITVRSLAASHNLHQVALIAAGGICPLVELLSYEAGEMHWPPEMREKATITVRAEAALALASLSVSNDDNKGAIGAAGAIPLLCDLIQYDDENHNTTRRSYQNQEMAPFFILAKDAGAGALSCLSKNEKNKDAIVAAQAIPVLVKMVDQGTSFARAAAANVLAKLATGDNVQNKVVVGREGAIPALLQLIKEGSPKARETAAEALANLALNAWNKAKILQEGGIECLHKLMEGGSSHQEKEAASLALKVLKVPIGPTSISNFLTDQKNRSCGSKISFSAEEGIPSVDLETKNYENGEQKKSLENKANFNMKNCSNSRIQEGLHVLRKDLSSINQPLPIVATMGTSELTSSLAPPLVGQPSIQVDAVIAYPKGPPKIMPSCKRLKTTNLSNLDIQSSQLLRTGPIGDQMNQKIPHWNGDAMQLACSDDKRNYNVNVWGRIGGGPSPSNQVVPVAGFCALNRADFKDQTRQCAEVDIQPVSGGIMALVDALSLANPGAQEFSALALMLLASQGGFEVKTTISNAGALPPLVAMVESSSSPMIRESAAAAISKLVSCHPTNRVAVIRAGGVRAMVNMAKWSVSLIDGPTGGCGLGARTQVAAIVAILNIGEVLDRQSMGMGLREALPLLAHMLENDNLNEVKAGSGGLQALVLTLAIEPQLLGKEGDAQQQHEWIQSKRFGSVAVEMITALLDLTKSTFEEARGAALEALAGFREQRVGAKLDNGSEEIGLLKTGDQHQQLLMWNRKEGVQALLTLLERCPCSINMREIVVGTFACAVASDSLSIYLGESIIIQQLMRYLQEGPTITTRMIAAATMANMGAKNKKIDAISSDNIILFLQLLACDPGSCQANNGPITFNQGSNSTFVHHEIQSHLGSQIQPPQTLNQYPMHAFLLQEHVAAILVYTALSGEKKKQMIIAAGAAPIFVRMLQGCLSSTELGTIHPSQVHTTSNTLVGPMFPQATQEFAMMGLILLADKSTETMESIVEAGGIPLLVKMLAATGGRGKLGANWSEMAAAALLTLAGCNNAREEMIRVGAIGSLVQVLKGEGGASVFSLTGLAAMAQLLGVLALNNQTAKLQMAEAGVVRCLVEILVGGRCLAWAAEGEGCTREGPVLVALAQEAAAAALATVVLHCPNNAKAAVEAGAIGPLVRLLGPIGLFKKDTTPEGFLTWKSIDSRARVDQINIIYDAEVKLIAETVDPKLSSLVEEEEGEMGRVGGPLAPMAALGNMVSCFPQCRQEVVDAGGAIKLTTLLDGRGWSKGEVQGQNGHEITQGANYVISQTKLQESAALVLELLTEGEKKMPEVIELVTNARRNSNEDSLTSMCNISLTTESQKEINQGREKRTSQEEPQKEEDKSYNE